MQSVKFVYWNEKNVWLGYLQEYPDYWTQGKTRKELEANLRDLLRDLTSGELPGIRRVGDLVVS